MIMVTTNDIRPINVPNAQASVVVINLLIKVSIIGSP
jgi:hypothetical protein